MPVRASGPARGLVALVRRALAEDRYRADLTSRAVVPRRTRAVGVVSAQRSGTVSGLSIAAAAARSVGLRTELRARDGERVRRGRDVLLLRGDARTILAVERTLLNVLMHASGVATATARAVAAARGSKPPLEIWATRKTLPGLRDLEKAAVVDGGGRPHRRDLSDGFLVKNNHLALVGLEEGVRRAVRRSGPGVRVEVEVRRRDEAVRAVRAGATALLLDNVGPQRARAIVRALAAAGLRRRVWVELSGGISPTTVGRFRSVGADAVSLGSVTHSAPAVPFHLTLRPPGLSRRAN